MTPSEYLVLACAMLATLGLCAWAWVWFALHGDGSSFHGLGSFEGMHFEDPVFDHPSPFKPGQRTG